ncbi:MAG: cysteine synthase family protein [Chloroflexi bacterium]|nr:cysteine synthase family protein [Chloroflexota bacterium]
MTAQTRPHNGNGLAETREGGASLANGAVQAPPLAPTGVRRFAGLLDAIGNTPLVELRHLSPRPEVRLWAKLEGHNPTGSLKDRIARAMVERAERRGDLTTAHTILEATSGNTGISLALVGKLKGYRVKVVMPENVSPERRELLEAYGAEVVLCDGGKGTNGAIEVAREMARDPRYFMPYQYGNEANPRAHYETTGAEILQALPEVDVFMAGLGTGGTLMGVGRRLREHNPSLKVIAVEPHPGELVQGLRSLDDGFIPPIVDLSQLDGKVLVRARDAFVGTRRLMDEEGIFAGISSGSVLQGALRMAQRIERGNIVLLLADGGWKYLSTHLWSQPIEALEQELDSKVWW